MIRSLKLPVMSHKPKGPMGGARPGAGRPRMGRVRLAFSIDRNTYQFFQERLPTPRGYILDEVVRITQEALAREV